MKQKQREQIVLPASRGNASTTVLDRAFARVKLGRVLAKPQRTGSTSVTAASARRPGPRGHKGRGLGEAQLLHPIREMRGTNYQVCGLFPFPMGGGSPLEGVPLGRNLLSGEPVCCDPISWFQKLRVIANPSAFIMANPGLGKSSLLRRMAIGLAAFGVWPMVLGDIKGEHVAMIEHLGGAVLPLGRGVGHINPLDDAGAVAAAKLLSAAKAEELLADLHTRRFDLIRSLIAILRKKPLDEREDQILDRCLTVLEARHTVSGTVPVMADLRQVLKDKPLEVREVSLDRGDDARYREVTDRLESSLLALTGGSELGQMFSAPTSEPIKRDRSVVFDVSSIDQTKKEERAAALLACWSAGFAMVNGAQLLADAGIERRRHYLAVMDELWQVLDSGPGMVERLDALTRLNRKEGAGQVMITHTMSDLERMPHEEDRSKARGFVERSDIVLLGGLSHQELDRVEKVLPLSRKERERIVSWTSPGSYDAKTRKRTNPPGMGHFLMKMSGRPGIAGRVELTSTEKRLQLHNTSRRWIEG